MTRPTRLLATLALASLGACSPVATVNTSAPDLPQSVARASALSQTQVASPITLRVTGCRAPVTCQVSPGMAYIVFYGYAVSDPKVTVTPVESGYKYGYAVEYCVQKVLTIDGKPRAVGDLLSECRNDDGFFNALDNTIDPGYVNSTQSLVFLGDGKANPSPANPALNSLSFSVFPGGIGRPQDRSYGFAVNLHLHDTSNHIAVLLLQWCRTVVCKPLN